MSPSAQDVIKILNLAPHPEKGHYIESYRDTSTSTTSSSRAHSTYIYYLLEGSAGPSRWHRVLDAVEVWHHYAGAPLSLCLFRAEDEQDPDNDGETSRQEHVLGPDLWAGQRPQVVVPRKRWQHARSLGDWSLVGCSVAPGFEFAGFEMAEPGWEPDGAAGDR